MLNVQLINHNFEYQVKDVLKLFFEEPPTFGAPESLSASILIKSEIESSLEHIIFSASIHHGEIFVSKKYEMPRTDSSEHDQKKLFKREIKRVLYEALVDFSGKKLPWGFLTGIRPAKIVHEMIGKNSKENIIIKLHDYYHLAKNKAGLLVDVAYNEKKILDKSKANSIGIYIGIPFCLTRCVYCSFTSNPLDKFKDFVLPYINALSKEIHFVGNLITRLGYEIESIYIGGGTPTTLDENQLAKLLTTIQSTFDLSNIREFTLEAGRPDTISKEKLYAIKESNVDRISINPQTMNDNILSQIGRNHTAQDIIDCFQNARELGFENINMDLIAGLPGDTFDSFENSIKKVCDLNPESITVHTMSLKKGSKLIEIFQQNPLTYENTVSQMVDSALAHTSKIGLLPYYLYRQKNIMENLENVGYAKPGFESVYNVQIMEEKQSIFALGAGGISKIVFPQENRIERIFNVKDVREYILRIDEMLERKERHGLNPVAGK